MGTYALMHFRTAWNELEAPRLLADFITVSAVAPSALSPLPSPLPKTFDFYAVTRINPLFVDETSFRNDENGDKVGETDQVASDVDRIQNLDNGDSRRRRRRRQRNLFVIAKQNCDFIRRVFASTVRLDRRGRRRRRTSTGEDVANGVESSRSQSSTGNSLRGPGLAVASQRRRRRRRHHDEKASESSGNESRLADVGSGRSNLYSHRRRIRCRLERYRSQRSANIRYEHKPSDDHAAILPYEKQTCSHSHYSSVKPFAAAAATTDCHGRAFTLVTGLPSHIARPTSHFRHETDECSRNVRSTTWPLVPIIYCQAYGGAYRLKSKNNHRKIAGNAFDIILQDRVLPYSGEFAPYADDQTPPPPWLQLPRARSSLLPFYSAVSTASFSYALASVSISNSTTSSSHTIEMDRARAPRLFVTKRNNAAAAATDTVRFDVSSSTLKTKGGEISMGTLSGSLVCPNAANSVCIAPICLHFPHCQRIDITCADDASSQGPLQTPSFNYNYNYAGRRCPDFTLDVQQTEQIVRKMKNRKRKRRWCRVVTCCAGLAFLLFSVMLFSMVLTGGEKLFGPLAFYD